MFSVYKQIILLNNLKTRTIMNAKILIHVICNDAMIYLLLYNLHDCAFKGCLQDSLANSEIIG